MAEKIGWGRGSRGAFFNESGLTIVEGLVGGVLATVVIAGLSAGVLQSLKLAKSVEAKTAMNNFHSLMSLDLANSNACKRLLPDNFSMSQSALDAISKQSCLGGDLNCPQVEIAGLRVAGQSIIPGTKVGGGSDVEFAGAKLILKESRAKLGGNPGEYLAELHYQVKRTAGSDLAVTSRSYPRNRKKLGI